MRSLALLLALAGCAGHDDHDDVPVEPAGGSQPPADDATSTLSGFICISDSLVDLRRCRLDELAGFTVSIGGNTAITDARGAFRLPAPSGSFLAFTVSGPSAVTTTVPFSPSVTVPVIDADVFMRTLASQNISTTDGQGAILGNVMRSSGTAAENVVVESTPASATALYDAEANFGLNATGARGVFLLPGITTGPATLRLRDTTGLETTVAGVQVVNGGVTILDSLVLP